MSLFNFNVNRCVVILPNGERINGTRAYQYSEEGDYENDGRETVVTSGIMTVIHMDGGSQNIKASSDKTVRIRPL